MMRTPQFKEDAVVMVRRGKAPKEVASSLGIGRSLLQYWRNQLEGEAEVPGTREGKRRGR